jgi:predicted protein tyrosine phosphatase
VLFVCRYNQMRSPTAERTSSPGSLPKMRSAGTNPDARVQVNELMLDWADVVFVMDDQQRTALSGAFPHHAAIGRLVTLNIEDDYTFLDPELVTLLRERVAPHLDRLRAGAARLQSPKAN